MAAVLCRLWMLLQCCMTHGSAATSCWCCCCRRKPCKAAAHAGSKRKQPESDPADAAAAQKRFMLVFNSAQNESDMEQLPLLMEMPEAAADSSQYKAVVQRIQRFMMRKLLLRHRQQIRIAEERVNRQVKVTTHRSALSHAQSMAAQRPGDEYWQERVVSSTADLAAAEAAAAAPDADLVEKPNLELLVDPTGLDTHDIERIIARHIHFTDTRVLEAKQKRRRVSYKSVVEAAEAAAATAAAEAAAAVAVAEKAAEEQGNAGDEDMQDADQDTSNVPDQQQAAPSAAATPAAGAHPAPAAAASDAELQYVAYGRVCVLYASWTAPYQVTDYNWQYKKLVTPEQQEGKDKISQQQGTINTMLRRAYRAQAPFLAVIDELQQLATFTRITPAGNARGVRYKPSIAVSLELVPKGRGASARDGTLKITVYTWPASSCPSRHHRTIDSVPGEATHHRPWEISARDARAAFKSQWQNMVTHVGSCDTDPSLRDAIPAAAVPAGQSTPSWLVRRSKTPTSTHLLLRQTTGLPLANTLLTLLQQQGQDTGCFDSWLQQAREWDSYVKPSTEAGTLLLHLLKTGPQEAAVQPRGFAAGLQLKPYQLEALGLMQAAEARPLGWSSVVWREVWLGGRSWWLSLATGKITSTQPHKQPTGGILAQEMGLGKTLCCLAVILANPAPALGPGDTAPGQPLPKEEVEDAAEQAQEADAISDDGEKQFDTWSDEDDEYDEAADGQGTAEQAEGDVEQQQGDGPAEQQRQGDEPAEQQQQQQHDQGGAPEEQKQQQVGQQAGTNNGPAAAATADGADADGAPAADGANAAGETAADTPLLYSRATLVVCAVSLVGQWADEAERRTRGRLKILQYHGGGRYKYTTQQLATDYDIVVTTYSILSNNRSKNSTQQKSPLACITWHRIIFDEGHVLKSRGTVQAQAASSLASDRRWVVTGTPISKEITEWQGLLTALQVWPFTDSRYATQHCMNAFKKQALSQGLCAPARQMPLVSLLKSVVIRHTKEVLELPDKTVEDVPVYLTSSERRYYHKALRSAQHARKFMGATVSNQRLRAEALLQPMRRICSGGLLPQRALTVPDPEAAAAAVAAAAAPPPAADDNGPAESCGSTGDPPNECCICCDAPEQPLQGPCWHVYCRACIKDALKEDTICPQCWAPLTAEALRTPGQRQQQQQQQQQQARPAAPAAAADSAGVLISFNSKLLKLKDELCAMQSADSSAKALIFSDFQATVDHLKRTLPQWGYSFRYINGSMPMHKRTSAIEAFQRDPPTTVFIATLRSASCGINLTAASHIFMLEANICPAREAQAIGRAWRMGQTRNVVVKRLYVKGSIEERAMQLAATAADRISSRQLADNYSLWRDNLSQLLEDHELPHSPAEIAAAAAARQQQMQQQLMNNADEVEEEQYEEDEEDLEEGEEVEGYEADGGNDIAHEGCEEEEEEDEEDCGAVEDGEEEEGEEDKQEREESERDDMGDDQAEEQDVAAEEQPQKHWSDVRRQEQLQQQRQAARLRQEQEAEAERARQQEELERLEAIRQAKALKAQQMREQEMQRLQLELEQQQKQIEQDAIRQAKALEAQQMREQEMQRLQHELEQRERQRLQRKQEQRERQLEQERQQRRLQHEAKKQQQQREKQEEQQGHDQQQRQAGHGTRLPLHSVENQMAGTAATTPAAAKSVDKPRQHAEPASGAEAAAETAVGAAAQLAAPQGGASDPAFSEFVLELMEHLGYSCSDADAAEAKLMAVAEQAVGVSPAPAAAAAGVDADAPPPAGAQQAAAQRWQLQFNAGLLRRHKRLAAGGNVDAAVSGLKAWIDQHLISASG